MSEKKFFSDPPRKQLVHKNYGSIRRKEQTSGKTDN